MITRKACKVVIDSEGYRLNVGIVVCNNLSQVLWAKRVGNGAWQFPQGGMSEGETFEEAMYRELSEEVGLLEADVEILACTEGWLKYRLPERYIRSDRACIGQKQKWFLLQLQSSDEKVNLQCDGLPEFDDWRWESYWYPVRHIVDFKEQVYKRALEELAPYLPIPMPKPV